MGTKTGIDAAGIPVACTLTTKAATEQALGWVDLQDRAMEVAALDGGVRMTFPASMVDDVEDLARREGACCTFLTIRSSVIDEVLTLDISSQSPEALAVISALAGIPLP